MHVILTCIEVLIAPVCQPLLQLYCFVLQTNKNNEVEAEVGHLSFIIENFAAVTRDARSLQSMVVILGRLWWGIERGYHSIDQEQNIVQACTNCLRRFLTESMHERHNSLTWYLGTIPINFWNVGLDMGFQCLIPRATPLDRGWTDTAMHLHEIIEAYYHTIRRGW